MYTQMPQPKRPPSWRTCLSAITALVIVLGMLSSKVPQAMQAAAPGDLLQFQSGGHVVGFTAGKMYVSNGTYALRVEFVGADKVAPQAADSASANDGAAPPLARVTYPNLWPGISLAYDAAGGIARSTYTLRPGADPAAIRLRYNAPVTVEADGSLRIVYANGVMRESAPVAWQEIDGTRVPVAVEFVLRSPPSTEVGEISFRLGAYNPRYPLTIDPEYAWHTFYGSVYDHGFGIAVDESDNVYVAGYSSASWLGDGDTAPLHAHGDFNDIVVVKLDSDGAYQWHTFYGGEGYDYSYGIAMDGSDVYVVGGSGDTWQGDGDADPLNPYSAGVDNIVVLKLDSDGAYQWHTFYEGEVLDRGNIIAVDGTSIYIAGYSAAAWGVPLHAYSGLDDIFVLKLNSSGAYQWHTFYGAAGDDDYGNGITLDGSANVYVTGQSSATWLGDGNTDPLNPHSGLDDIFALKLNSSGAYQWHTFYGNTGVDHGYAIMMDGTYVYVTGDSAATWQGDGDTAPLHTHSGGGFDIAVLKLDDDGAYQWHTFYGGTGIDNGDAIVVDESGGVYITGDSAATWDTPLHAYSGGYDIVILKLDGDGAYRWHTFYGSGSNHDFGRGITLDGGNNVYVTGQSSATWLGDGDTDPLHPYYGNDIVVLKLYGVDWGDLDSPYPTMRADDGARHTIVSGAPYLGSVAPDNEDDGQPNATATGDDLNGVPDDEDGVARAAGLGHPYGGWTNGLVSNGQGGAVAVTISDAPACLGAFLDVSSGTLIPVTLRDNTGTAIVQPLAVGSYTFYFNIPPGTFPGSGEDIVVSGRFRVTSPVGGVCTGSAAYSATGLADDGEVEDYVWSFSPNAITLRGLLARSGSWGIVALGCVLVVGLVFVWRRKARD